MGFMKERLTVANKTKPALVGYHALVKKKEKERNERIGS